MIELTDATRITMRVPDGSWVLFDVEDCEACGQTCQVPNSFVLDHETAQLLSLKGVRVVDDLPPEQWWDDDLGHCVCGDCYTEVTQPPIA